TAGLPRILPTSIASRLLQHNRNRNGRSLPFPEIRRLTQGGPLRATVAEAILGLLQSGGGEDNPPPRRLLGVISIRREGVGSELGAKDYGQCRASRRQVFRLQIPVFAHSQ